MVTGTTVVDDADVIVEYVTGQVVVVTVWIEDFALTKCSLQGLGANLGQLTDTDVVYTGSVDVSVGIVSVVGTVVGTVVTEVLVTGTTVV